VNAVMNFRVPKNAGNFLTGCKPVSFSRRALLQVMCCEDIHFGRAPMKMVSEDTQTRRSRNYQQTNDFFFVLFSRGFQALVNIWNKCTERSGDCVQK